MSAVEEVVINIDEAGRIEAIYHDALAPIIAEGLADTRRASHVEPDGNGWLADMGPSNGPVLSGFATRGEALAAEVAWLKQNCGL